MSSETCPEGLEGGLRLSVRLTLAIAIIAGILLGLGIYQLVVSLDTSLEPHFNVFLLNPPYDLIFLLALLILAFVVLYGLWRIRKNSCSSESVPFFGGGDG